VTKCLEPHHDSDDFDDLKTSRPHDFHNCTTCNRSKSCVCDCDFS